MYCCRKALILLAALAGGILLLNNVPASADNATVSSKAMLLTPALTIGSVFTWSNALIENGKHLPPLVLACRVESRDGSGFRVLPSAGIGSTPLQALSGLEFTLQDGRALGADGKPMQHDPVCYFYLTSRYGDPPETLHVGSSWTFSYPEGYTGGLAPNARGTVLVTNIDNANTSVTLRINFTGAGTMVHDNQQFYRESTGTFDLVVSNGGIITGETIEKLSTKDQFPSLNSESEITGRLKLEN